MQPAIEIKNLGKEYKLESDNRYLALRDVISGKFKNAFSTNNKENNKKIWALKDITLNIMPGEKVGIIGLNGAGKSTLLKIISRITPPSTGKILARGRVGSLLEVGTGFHPELSGRENIYLNGSILGLRKKEIDRQLDEIVNFSGVEKHIESPVKHYSSGMQMRLAFAVASHLDAEILLIDEVLAVGDIEFQQKCLGKMREISISQGRTILFVSHDLSAVGTLTDKSIFLKNGKLHEFGITADVISSYTNSIRNERVFSATVSNRNPYIKRAEVICSEGDIHAFGKDLKVIFEVDMPEADQPNMALSFQVISMSGMQPILHYHLFDIERTAFRKKGVNKLEFTTKNFRLYKGEYFLRIYLAESKTKNEYQRIDCCYFRVEMLGIKEIEWGWSNNMCTWLDEGTWELE